MPVGASTVLGLFTERLITVLQEAKQELLVFPTFRPDDDYAARVQGAAILPVTVVDGDELAGRARDCEAQDAVAVMDSAQCPVGEADLRALAREHADTRTAVHCIAVGQTGAGVRERVEMDESGQVTRVRRLYDRIDGPDALASRICVSVLPARAVAATAFSSLVELRSALFDRGLLCCDVATPLTAVDLTQPQGLLALNEGAISRDGHGPAPPAPSRGNGSALLIGRGCRVDPSARMVGPVAMHDDVVIEPGATIVGPTVIGAGCRIGKDAIVAQSVLAPGTRVSASGTLRHSIAAGQMDNGAVITPVSETILPIRPTTGDPRDGAGGGSRDVDPWRGKRGHAVLKRAFDFAVSVSTLTLMAPVLIATALLVKLDSSGPVFFLHRRERKGGRDFPCLKFRTMVADAHSRQRELYTNSEVDGPQFKLRNDPRLTRVGYWLRLTNLDELPQLLNVLIGHMSLVGPRPSPFRENQICVPWRRARLSVRPGITGLWQICRNSDRSKGGFDEWIRYDIDYVRHFSLWLDMKILWFTVVTLGGQRSVPVSRLIPNRCNGHHEE